MGMWAKPDRSSPRSQCETSNPGAMKRMSVAAKATGANASEMFLRGRSRVAATAQESRARVSADFGRGRPLISTSGDFVFTGLPRRLQAFPSPELSILSLRSHPGDTCHGSHTWKYV